MTKELARTLTVALVSYLDENRPEGTMDCSSGECVLLEKSFVEENFDSVETLIKKKLSRLAEFEQEVSDIVEYCKEHGENVAFDYAKRHAKTLLALAKKELLSYADESNPKIEAMADLERAVTCGNVDNIPKWLVEEFNKAFKKGQESSHEDYVRGYTNGYKDAEKRYNESVSYHFPNPPAINIPTWTPPCYNGGPCTNPLKDCINCPRTNVVITASGTSELKAEG